MQVGTDAHNRGGNGNGRRLACRRSSRGIEFQRPADAVYTLKVLYTPKPPTLTESAGREWYDGWENYVIEKVLLELDSRERMPLNDRLVKLEAAERALRASSNARRQQEPEYLTLREYNDLDPFLDGMLD